MLTLERGNGGLRCLPFWIRTPPSEEVRFVSSTNIPQQYPHTAHRRAAEVVKEYHGKKSVQVSAVKSVRIFHSKDIFSGKGRYCRAPAQMFHPKPPVESAQPK